MKLSKRRLAPRSSRKTSLHSLKKPPLRTPVNKLDSEGCRPFVRADHAGFQARAKAKSHLTGIKITALLNALVVEKQATHVPSANTGTIHAMPVGNRVILQMHASLNLRRSTRWKSQKRHNSTPLLIHFLSQSSTSVQRTMVSKYPLNGTESIH